MAVAPLCAAQTPAPILIDARMTPATGASVVTNGGAALAAAEGFVPHRIVADGGAGRRTANVSYRLARLMFFDLPQESLLVVINHELFGHGARLRELLDGSIAYRFAPPAPYGKGGGSTSYLFNSTPSDAELMAIDAGGMEASGLAASLITKGAVVNGVMDPRSAIRYLQFELDTMMYVLSSRGESGDAGHDVDNFLESYNGLAFGAGAAELRARTIGREAMLSLANPMVAFALAGLLQYVSTGDTIFRVPTFSIGGVSYLPMMRYRLAPYGTELAVVNELAGTSRAATIEVRFGRAPTTTPWGISYRQLGAPRWGGLSLGMSAHVWRQPAFVGQPGADVSQQQFGAELLGRAEQPIASPWAGKGPVSFVVEAGFKSAGYVPGEPLGRGLVVRAGVGLPLGR